MAQDNIIYLADLDVPSYRRKARAPQTGRPSASPGGWLGQARQRAAAQAAGQAESPALRQAMQPSLFDTAAGPAAHATGGAQPAGHSNAPALAQPPAPTLPDTLAPGQQASRRMAGLAPALHLAGAVRPRLAASVQPPPALPALSAPTRASAPARPLRVTRVVHAQARPGHFMPLSISGRLIDVCAELDRLLAAESQAA